MKVLSLLWAILYSFKNILQLSKFLGGALELLLRNTISANAYWTFSLKHPNLS